jgi:hypothetical protein
MPRSSYSLRDATSDLPRQIAIASGAAAGDVDRDGFDDIAIFRPQRLQLLRNDGEGRFQFDAEAFPGWASGPRQKNNRFVWPTSMAMATRI